MDEARGNAAAGVRHKHKVVLTSVGSTRLRLTDWRRSAPESPGGRGHGLRVIETPLNPTDPTTAEYGTTVEIHKELRS